MNHRDLILSARKKARFHFLTLPESLQDEVIDGLDGGTLTLEAASALVKARGHSLSHEAIAGYHRAVRRERRLLEMNQEVSRIIAEFSQQPHEAALKALVGAVIGMAAVGLADGTVGIKDVDLGTLLRAMRDRPVAPPAKEKAGETTPAAEAPRGLTKERADEIRREILGVDV